MLKNMHTISFCKVNVIENSWLLLLQLLPCAFTFWNCVVATIAVVETATST